MGVAWGEAGKCNSGISSKERGRIARRTGNDESSRLAGLEPLYGI
jgi:hypothetical protein